MRAHFINYPGYCVIRAVLRKFSQLRLAQKTQGFEIKKASLFGLRSVLEVSIFENEFLVEKLSL